MLGTSNLGSWNGHWQDQIHIFPRQKSEPEPLSRPAPQGGNRLAGKAFNCGGPMPASEARGMAATVQWLSTHEKLGLNILLIVVIGD